jgi:hypothetical protein
MVTGHLSKWEGIILGSGVAVVLGMLLYPPWHCYTSTGYRVPTSTLKQLAKGPPSTDFPPSEPMLYDVHKSRLAYAWLFCPPVHHAGVRWHVEIEWGRLGTRCGLALLATVALLMLLRGNGILIRFFSRQKGP